MLVKNDKLMMVENTDIIDGEFIIPNNINNIEIECFEDCTNLKRIELPLGMEFVVNKLFCGCNNLEEVIIPNTIKAIGNRSFYNCHKLRKINIPDGVVKIGEGAFYNCGLIENIDVPPNLKYIGDYAFQNCKSLKSLNIGDDIDYIGVSAFKGCNSLDNIENMIVRYLTTTNRMNKTNIKDINNIVSKLKEELIKELFETLEMPEMEENIKQKLKNKKWLLD